MSTKPESDKARWVVNPYHVLVPTPLPPPPPQPLSIAFKLEIKPFPSILHVRYPQEKDIWKLMWGRGGYLDKFGQMCNTPT